MNENQSGSGNLLDTTDCLEAVGVFKGWKNFFFLILLVCIALLQACFWLVELDMIEAPPMTLSMGLEINAVPAGVQDNEEIPGFEIFVERGDDNILPDDDDTEQEIVPEPIVIPEIEEAPEAEEVTEPEAIEPNAAPPIMLASETTVETTGQEETETEQASEGFLFGVTFEHLVWVIRFANAILVLTAVLYCLTMIFSLKVSMLGRLGGINHITRAFFLSLILLILVLPWQKIFDGLIMGAIFTPAELIIWHAKDKSDILDLVLYYMRFCGYMVLVFLLLILAQLRSSRWAKAILRRLEII